MRYCLSAVIASIGYVSQCDTPAIVLRLVLLIQVQYRQSMSMSIVNFIYDHGLLQLLRDELHWLDVPERVQIRISAKTRA